MTYCDCGEKSFWDVAHDDADDEDDGVRDARAQVDDDDEEDDAHDDGDDDDQVDEVGHVTSEGCCSDVKSRRQVGNPPHHGPFPSPNDHPTRVTWCQHDIWIYKVAAHHSLVSL